MKRSTWLWPVVMVVSALAASFINFVIPGVAGRPIKVIWFLCLTIALLSPGRIER
jgi:hypothetical protein